MAAAALIGRPSGRRFTLDRGDVVSFVTPGYLGLERHPRVAAAAARAAREWGISTVTPRALLRDPLTRALERRLAAFVDQPAALVFASSRHAACDVLPSLAGRGGTLCVDGWAYPTSMDGVREARRQGARVVTFAHGDLTVLRQQLERASSPTVIVTDGVHSAGAALAPLRAYVALAERFDAVVYMDDSHGLGLLGRRVARDSPYGVGGGGLRRYASVPGRRVIVAGTLAKALGSPVAFVAGDSTLLRRAADTAASLVHDSPPSIPNVAAALAALAVHDVEGERLRRRVRTLVMKFRSGIRAAGLELGSRSVFPIQTVVVRNDMDETDMRDALFARGVWPLVLSAAPDHPGDRVVRFFLTALHTPADIDRAVDAVSGISDARAARPARRVYAERVQLLYRAQVPRPRARRATPRRTSRTAAGDASSRSTGSP